MFHINYFYNEQSAVARTRGLKSRVKAEKTGNGVYSRQIEASVTLSGEYHQGTFIPKIKENGFLTIYPSRVISQILFVAY